MSCTDGENPTKNSIFEWPVTLSVLEWVCNGQNKMS